MAGRFWFRFCSILVSVFSLLLLIPYTAYAQAFAGPSETKGASEVPITGSISGHVFQADGVTAISGANVTANAVDVEWASFPVSTAADGSYTITGIPTGNYKVMTEIDGFVTEYYDGAYAYYQASTIGVTAPDNKPDIDFTLDVARSISGYVYQNNGATPISGASVSAIDLDYTFAKAAVSAVDGSYTITGIPEGNYRVSSSASGYVMEYYDNANVANQATGVNVSPSTNRTGIDFTLDPSGSISGHVYKADRVTPLSGALVSSKLSSGTFGAAMSGADGAYSIAGAPPGNNTVIAQMTDYVYEYYREAYNLDDAITVLVAVNQNTPDIDFSLEPGGLITGYVYATDGTTPVSGATISATDETNRTWQATSSGNGSYSTPYLPAGNYTLKAEATGYTTEYYDGVSTVGEATAVTVTVPGTISGKNFTIDPIVITPPTVITGNANPSFTSALLSGNVTDLGTAASVTTRFRWGTSDASLTNTIDCQTLTDIGAFSGNITGLSPATTYYYRAEATGDDTGQGEVKNFTAQSNAPAVSTSNASNVGYDTARLNGNLTDMGTASSVNLYFEYGTSPGNYPNETPVQSAGNIGEYYAELSNLTDNRTYYYRAKASGHGIVYGLEESFTTKAQGQLPVATTDDATNITYSSARLNGTVTSLGTSQSTEVRFTWGTTPGVYTGTSQSLIVNTVGPIYFDASGLSPNTTYYYRAHITYSLGPGENGEFAAGIERSFTTSTAPPPPTTTTPPYSGGGGFSGGGGGAPPPGPGITNLTIYTNSEGLFSIAGEAKSEDGEISLVFSKGVLAQTKDNARLSSVKIVPTDSPTDAPAGSVFIGLAFELTPEGATFTPAIPLTIYFDPATMPPNIDLSTLYIMFYNPGTSSWEKLPSTVNQAESSVTAFIEHFSIYTIAGQQKAAPTTAAAYTPLPAKFEMSYLVISPDSVTAGQSVTITARVSNTGETDGQYEVVLKVNGTVETTKVISVKAGDSASADFMTKREAPGDYEVDINGNRTSFTVKEPLPKTTTPIDLGGPPPSKPHTNWTIIGVCVGGAGLVIAIGLLLMRRRQA